MQVDRRRYKRARVALYAVVALSAVAFVLDWGIAVVLFMAAGVGLLVVDILRRSEWW